MASFVPTQQVHRSTDQVVAAKGWTWPKKGESVAGKFDGNAALKAFAAAMAMADPETKAKLAKIKADETKAGVNGNK